ncbi:MAG: SprT-like domain-containing protein [Bowdeniella nasicola]|nr:SprT-like domain-containing protein [Bowdeniella nasicola]
MNLAELERYARALMDREGLTDWTFGYDRARRRVGCCHHGPRKITLSRHLMERYPQDLAREVVIHEVAHALVGPDVHHGPAWRAQVLRLGGTPRVTAHPDAPRPNARWLGLCACGATFPRLNRPAGWRDVRCASCLEAGRGGHLTWRRVPEESPKDSPGDQLPLECSPLPTPRAT